MFTSMNGDELSEKNFPAFHVHEILKIESTSVDVYFFAQKVMQVYW